MCYFLGDLNIDLFKCDDHKPTSNFLDTMYSYNMFPLIVKLTRVTVKSATLIDHIWTNSFDAHSQHKQGILLTSMSDHYGIFHITSSKMDKSSGNENVCLKRYMCHRNIEKFISKIQAVDWQKTWLKPTLNKHIVNFMRPLQNYTRHVSLLERWKNNIITTSHGWQLH